MTVKLFKDKFYSRTCYGCTKREGWSDNRWHYFKSFSKDDNKEMWYAIDPMSGLSVAKEHTKTDVVNKVYSPEFIKKFNQYRTFDKYSKQCTEWYDMQVEAGIIVNNYITDLD